MFQTRWSRIVRLCWGASLGAALAFAHSYGPAAGLTGAPGEGNCTACHSSFPVNSGSGSLKLELVGATTYTSGTQYQIKVTLADPSAQRWGFELSSRQANSASTAAGTLALASPTETTLLAANNVQYVTQTTQSGADGTHQGTTGSTSWTVNWTAPNTSTGPVTFYVAGNAANGNSAPTGDRIYTSSLTVQPASSQPDVTGNSYVIPQVAFGGGWYTALYFTNTGSSSATYGLKFYKDDGSDMAVTLPDGSTSSTQTVTLSGNSTSILELNNVGDLTQGWAEATLPAGVTGYAVFRQSVSGRADQEAVVPLSDDSKSKYTMIWDDTGFTTALAIVNPDDATQQVTLTAYDASGNSVGSATVSLTHDNKTAVVMRNIQQLAGVAGKRGSVVVSVPSGKLAVLGLRFGASAFTSIPVVASN